MEPRIRIFIACVLSLFSCGMSEGLAETPQVLLFPESYRGQEVERGLLLTHERPKKKSGNEIAVGFLRYPATGEVTAPPLFILPGGPGFSYRDMTDAQLALAPFFEIVRKLRESQDVIIPEQRGMSYSYPTLDCERKDKDTDDVLTAEDLLAVQTAWARACREAWIDRGVDIEAYTVVEAARDIDTLRQGLGYDKINLLGLSFGSHWSMAVMRYHPEIVQHVLLAGVEGPDHTFDQPAEVLYALERIADGMAQEPSIAPYVPEGGLISALKETIARLDAEPQTVTVTSKAGDVRQVVVRGEDIRRIARGYPYAGSRSGLRHWPATILEAYRGHYERAAKAKLRAMDGQPWSALFMAMDCPSGGTATRREAILRDPAADIIGPLNDRYFAACAVWNDRDLGDRFRAGFKSEIPTLMIQGDWDLSTPIENAYAIKEMFRKRHFLTIRRGTHDQIWSSFADDPDLFSGVQVFFETGNVDNIPSEITAPIPPLALPKNRPH